MFGMGLIRRWNTINQGMNIQFANPNTMYVQKATDDSLTTEERHRLRLDESLPKSNDLG